MDTFRLTEEEVQKALNQPLRAEIIHKIAKQEEKHADDVIDLWRELGVVYAIVRHGRAIFGPEVMAVFFSRQDAERALFQAPQSWTCSIEAIKPDKIVASTCVYERLNRLTIYAPHLY